MNQQTTPAWCFFSFDCYGAAAAMMAMGIWALPVEFWAKGYLGMAMVFLIGSTFTLAKTQRDEFEAKRLTNRLDEAKAEKLLMEIDRAA
jgi:hypothetical protein